MKNAPKYSITVNLIGNDGNAFAILGSVQKALRAANVDKAEIDAYFAEATSGDYDNLLRVTTKWVEVA
jgi:hypothetical protein